MALDRRFGLPLIVNDGVTVARDIELSDPVENLGAVLLREAATKTEQAAGDGTTTATVLAKAILDVGFRHLAFGADALQIKRGLDTGRDALIGAIRAAAIPVTDRAQSAHVAAISANDLQIGQLVAKVLDRVGTDGAVDIEESRTLRHEVEYVQGLAFDRGYLSAYFVTDPERMSCVIDKPRILVTGGEISAVTDLVPILELLVAAGERSLIVLAGDVPRRGVGDAGGEPPPRDVGRGGRQGARVRRSPPRSARRSRDGDRRNHPRRRECELLREADPDRSRPSAAGCGHARAHHHCWRSR